MVLSILTGAIYEVVRHSWLVASSVLMILLPLFFVYESRDGLKSLGEYEDALLEYSPALVTGIVVTGFLGFLTGFEFEPVFKLVGEVVALAYFGFLFWKF
ncbi:MAG: hypothetical protein ABEJ83_01490 [Candidatus Nanohaloarchaea archaeon]